MERWLSKNALSNKLRSDFKSVCIWRSRNHKCKTNIDRFFFAQRSKQAFTSHLINPSQRRRLSVFHTNQLIVIKVQHQADSAIGRWLWLFPECVIYLLDPRSPYPRLPLSLTTTDITDAISNSRQRLMLEFNLYSLHVIEQLIRIHASHHVENVTDMFSRQLPSNVC